MYKNLGSKLIKRLKPLVSKILLPITALLLIPFILLVFVIFVITMITIFVVTLFLFTINFTLLYINKKIIRKQLQPILKEIKDIYNIDIVKFEHIIYCKNNHITYIKIPIRFKNISSAVKEFKEKTGSLDSYCFSSAIFKVSAINSIKKETGNVFFSTLSYNEHLKNNIHLYDLSELDSKELQSLYSTGLSDEQKFLIHKKYRLE